MSAYVSLSTPLFTTAITVSELTYGAHKSESVERNLSHVTLLLKGLTVLPFDTKAAQHCGALKDKLRRAGIPPAEPDLQIAGIALVHKIPLVTHNQRHFARVSGLKLVDWM